MLAQFVRNHTLGITLAIASILSIGSLVYFASQDMITAYGDAIARLMIARQVVDSANPGLTQLGGIWLPFPHALTIPLIGNNFLYQTGFAGASISMFSYIIAVYYLYKLVYLYTFDRKASVISVIAFSTPNIMFLQSTPMSEMIFIAFLVASCYYLTKWTANPKNIKYLGILAVTLMLGSMTRYEAWVLAAIVSGIVLLTLAKNFSYGVIEDRFIFFLTISLYGILIWVIWNTIIFKDPLYFMRSEFAPWYIAKRALMSMNPLDRPQGNLLLSTRIYTKTVIDTVGIASTIFALGGLTMFLVKKFRAAKLNAITLSFPIVFYILTLYFGMSVVIWHPEFANGANWGTRYGSFMVPIVAFFVAILVAGKRFIVFIILSILILTANIASLKDGILSAGEAISNKYNPDAVLQTEAGLWLSQNYDRGIVLIQRFGNERIVFASHFPLSKMIYEGSEQGYLKECLENPYGSHVDWIVITHRGNDLDSIGQKLKDNTSFKNDYYLAYQNDVVSIYKVKPHSL